MPRPRLSAQASGLPGGASPPSQEQADVRGPSHTAVWVGMRSHSAFHPEGITLQGPQVRG